MGPATGESAVVTGTGQPGSSGDGAPAVGARIDAPGAPALDSHEAPSVAESGEGRVRLVAATDPPDGTVADGEGDLTLGSIPWGAVAWSIAGLVGLVVVALAVLVLRRPTEAMISVVAWGVALYTSLRERGDRIRGRGGSRSGAGDRETGPGSGG
ncbi:hypothetical protein EFW17_04125 [Halostreptopolyspora alba]|uniref:Uncharacterized protein n=2 Tax=Halostreptopolyspora alba TaxID=2487137 RepID=A0A3N0EEW8_9ACTN|nr:hypothetical protein EFW17_04125 [Nocardiopsaceae bacterium YIM 96095]